MVRQLHRVEQVDRVILDRAMVPGSDDEVDRPLVDIARVQVRIGQRVVRDGHGGAVGVALRIARAHVEGLARNRCAEVEAVLDPPGVDRALQIGLVEEHLVAGIAGVAARSAAWHEKAGRGAGDAARSEAGRQAERAFGAVRDRILPDVLIAGQVTQRDLLAELLVQDRRQLVDGAVLLVEITIAVIAAATGARHLAGEAVGDAADIGHAELRDVVVLLVEVQEAHLRRAVKAEGDRGHHAPALGILHFTAGNVVAVVHCVQGELRCCPTGCVDIGGGAIIIVGAHAGLHHRAVGTSRALADQVDVAGDRAAAGIDRVRAVGDFDLLDVEIVRAGILRAVANVIDGDVAVRAEAAQIDAVAIAAAAFAGAEGDAGHRRQRVAQRQDVLLLHHFGGDHRYRLRGIAQRAGVLGALLLGLVDLTVDGDLILVLRILRRGGALLVIIGTGAA
jgi:hypothetical protein